MTTETTPATKRCPGFAGIGQEPHELPADNLRFNQNSGSKDGLSTRCRVCGNAYGAAWSARKRAIAKADAMPIDGGAGSVARDTAVSQASAYTVEDYGRFIAEAKALDAGEEPKAVSPLRARDEAAAPAAPAATDRAERPGWSSTRIAGVLYAVPVDATEVGTAEGQAALAQANEARKAQARDQKRAERARKADAEATT